MYNDRHEKMAVSRSGKQPFFLLLSDYDGLIAAVLFLFPLVELLFALPFVLPFALLLAVDP